MITIGFVECLYQRIRGALPWSRDKLRILEVHFIYFFFRNAGSMFRRFWGGGILLVGELIGVSHYFIDIIYWLHHKNTQLFWNHSSKPNRGFGVCWKTFISAHVKYFPFLFLQGRCTIPSRHVYFNFDQFMFTCCARYITTKIEVYVYTVA